MISTVPAELADAYGFSPEAIAEKVINTLK